MTTQFKNFKLSFIWVETIPAIAARELDPKASYAFFGTPGRFAQKFDAIKKPGEVVENLELPWPKPIGHHFWQHYFGGRQAGSISGLDAWNNHVPLRGTTASRILLNAPEPRVTFEMFYSSQGVGLVANAYYRGKNKSLEEIVDLARMVRAGYRYRTSEDQAGMSLQHMAEHLLADAQQTAFGKAEATLGFNQPLTIATFVQGQADDGKLAVPQGGPVHHALEALTGWNDKLEIKQLANTPINSAMLAIHTRADSDLVYARDKGRAIWLPREFAPAQENAAPAGLNASNASPSAAGAAAEAEAAGPAVAPQADVTADLTATPEDETEARGPPRLSCYHRNLTLASLQTMSLGEFVGLVGRKLTRGEKVPDLLLARAKSAARVLNVLASGDRTQTYRSKSIEAQINAANWRSSMDIVAKS